MSPLRWFLRRRRDVADDRDWRRKLVLATRKIQHVHQSVSSDVAEVRALRSHLTDARPEFEDLQNELLETRTFIHDFSEAMVEHQKLMQKTLEREPGYVPPPMPEELTAQQRVVELETRIQELGSAQAELEAKHAAETAALLDAKNARIAELERERAERSEEDSLTRAQLSDELLEEREKNARRVAELELQLRGLESTRADLEEEHRARRRELESLVEGLEEGRKTLERRYQDEVRQLRSRLEELQSSRGGLEARHAAELAEVSAEMKRRCGRLKREIQELEGARVAVEEHGREEVARLNRERTDAEVLHASELADLIEQHEAQVASLAAQAEGIDAAKSAHEEEYQRKFEELQARHRVRVNELEAEVAELSQGLVNREREDEELLERNRRNWDARQREEIEELEAGYRERIAELEAQLERASAHDSGDFGDFGVSGAGESGEPTASADLVAELEQQVTDLKEARAYLEINYTEQIAQLKRDRDARIAELERRHTEELDSFQRPQSEGDPEQASRLRELEQLNAALETKHMQEVMQLADHGRARVAEAEARIKEKDELIDRLNQHARELESRFGELCEDLGDTTPDLEAKANQLIEMLRGLERDPTSSE